MHANKVLNNTLFFGFSHTKKKKKKVIIIQCNEAESASPRPENKYSGVPEAYSGLVTFKYASGTPEYIYISYQHFGHEQKSIYPQILWFSIQR